MNIDGTDVSSYGVIVQNRRSSKAAANIKQAYKGAPGAWRNIRLGRNAPDPLLWTCSGFITATSHANLLAQVDQLKWRTRPNKELTLQWSDQSTIEWLGYRQSLDIQGFVPDWIQTACRFTLIIFCPDPRARNAAPSQSSTSGTAPLTRTIDVGSAPHPITITITGNSSQQLVNPVVNYRDYNNATVSSFSISDTLDETETYTINTETHVVEKTTGSVVTNGGGNFSGTMFDCDPDDADPSTWPIGTVSVQLTADSGDADNFQVNYRRRWW